MGKNRTGATAPTGHCAVGSGTSRWVADPRETLKATSSLNLASLDRAATPGWVGSEADARAYVAAVTPLLATLQERLFAAAKEGSSKRVLVVAQGLDTAGKGGIARHVMGLVDPQGVHLTAFKAPTEEERRHGFLWRIRKAVPTPGLIGFFDRSHYEDILVPGANGHLDQQGFTQRVETIHGFERELVTQGTAIIKIALMVSYQEQGLRLLARVDRPDKHWKYSSGDMGVRSQWFAYQSIYERTLAATSFAEAPWHVIPADNKWFARLAVTELLLRTLADLDVKWPRAHFDVEVERERIRATIPPADLARYDAQRPQKLERVTRRIAQVDAAATYLSDCEEVLAADGEPHRHHPGAVGSAPPDPGQSPGGAAKRRAESSKTGKKPGQGAALRAGRKGRGEHPGKKNR